jgi:hypothetical protein
VKHINSEGFRYTRLSTAIFMHLKFCIPKSVEMLALTISGVSYEAQYIGSIPEFRLNFITSFKMLVTLVHLFDFNYIG